MGEVKSAKRRWRVFLCLLLILGVGGTLFLWIAAGRLAGPPRREIQDYHRSYLENPSHHGQVVTSLSLLEERVPVIIARPAGMSGPGKRGMILREQLTELGVALPVHGEEKALLVLLHGRNGRKEDLLPVAARFCAVGFICVIPDLPAHGESPVETVAFGSREFEAELPGKIADEVMKHLGREGLPQYLWGMSMGGSFAIHSAGKEPKRWERMVIVASFDFLEGVVEDSLRDWSGPAAPVLLKMVAQLTEWRGGAELAKVKPVDLAEKITVPTLVIHGDEDGLIAHSRGERLHAGFSGEKKFLTVSGGNHDNVLVTDAPVYAEMATWFLSE